MKIQSLREDPATQNIFDFLINLPKDDFRVYGHFIKEIYECKVQQGSGASQVLINREKSELMAKIDAHIQKKMELENEVSAKDKIISNLKSEADKERMLRDLEIQGKVNEEKKINQKQLTENEEKFKKNADAKVNALQNDKQVQAAEISNLRLRLDNEKEMKQIDITRKADEEKLKQESKWAADIAEKKKQIQQLLAQKDADKEKFEKYFLKGNSDMAQSNEKILNTVREIEKVMVKPLNSAQIGQEGEEYVLQALKIAFPNNKRIFQTKQNQCGDIMFNIENTNKWIMFEVKDVEGPNIKNHKQGSDIKKFYTDSKTNKLGYQIDAAVLVSLKCIVDATVPNLTPFVKEGKPYMYVDEVKKDTSDPVSMFRAIVGMMKFMIDHCADNKVENFGVKMNKYIEQTSKSLVLYQRMQKDHNSMGKRLEEMKECLDMHIKLLESDKAENEGTMKRNGAATSEPQPKYPKTEPGFSDF